MIFFSFALCVMFSAECTIGQHVSSNDTALADEAFNLLRSSLYCAPNGSFEYYDPALGWLQFDSKTLPSKYQLPVCNDCPVCIAETCSSCVPRPLGASCNPCVSGEPWPSPENLKTVAPRCLSCLFGLLKQIVHIKPCNKKRKFDWIGWMEGAVKDTSTPHRPPVGYLPPQQISVYPPPQISVYPPPQISVYPPSSQVFQQPQQYYPPKSPNPDVYPQYPQQTKQYFPPPSPNPNVYPKNPQQPQQFYPPPSPIPNVYPQYPQHPQQFYPPPSPIPYVYPQYPQQPQQHYPPPLLIPYP